MKQVSFEVAQTLKEVGYPQWSVEESDNSKLAYDCEGELWEIRYFDQNPQVYYTAPTCLEVWLWIWREKGIHIDIDYCINQCSIFDITNKVIYTRTFADPEEAIEQAIEYLIENDLIK